MVERFANIIQTDREALTLHFKSSRPYAVKLFVDSNNAQSGEPKIESTTTFLRQKHRLTVGDPIQDYSIVGELTFDTFKTLAGESKQFVAGTPRLQVQVMPVKRVGMCVVVKRVVEGVLSTFSMEGLEGRMLVKEVKEMIWTLKDVKAEEQLLVLKGMKLEDGEMFVSFKKELAN